MTNYLFFFLPQRIIESDEKSTFIESSTLFFVVYKNVVFPTQAEYSYFSADFRLKRFLYYCPEEYRKKNTEDMQTLVIRT